MWPLGGWEATVFISVSESVSVFGVDVLIRRSGWVYEGETGGDPGALGANWPIWTHRAPPSRTPLCNQLCPTGEQITCSCAQFQRAQNFAIHSNTMGSSNVCNQPSCKTHVAVPSITVWAMLCYDSNHTDDKMAAVNSMYTFFVICVYTLVTNTFVLCIKVHISRIGDNVAHLAIPYSLERPWKPFIVNLT